MKRLLTILFIALVAAGVYVGTVESQPTAWLSVLANNSVGPVFFRALSTYGVPVTIGHGTAAPTQANSSASPMDGELYVTRAAATDPVLRIFSQTAATWYDVPFEDTMTMGGAWTYTAAQDFQGNVIFGNDEADTITTNAPVEDNIYHETFDSIGCGHAVEEDYTAAVVTDASENMILMPCSQLGVIAYRIEAPGGPGLADTPAPFAVDGVFSTDGYVDPVDNEGIVFVFGSAGPDLLGAYYDEDANVDVFAEANITITTIANIDDLWFGFVMLEAYDNPPASIDYDTAALFVLSDDAGDLDIETELNAGGTLNDDAVTVWADGANHTLKVELGADAVAFVLDGVAVAQTNAVLNADNGDRAVVVLGYTLDASGADPGISVDWVTIGLEQ